MTGNPVIVLKNQMPEQATRRHPEAFTYRCFLSDLTRFAKLRRAGPTQAAEAYTNPHHMSSLSVSGPTF